eukprot:01453.XXX_1907_3703_1 [CDS] Oithona nana genome sequencing.
MSSRRQHQRRNPSSAASSDSSHDKMGDQRLAEFLAETTLTLEEEGNLKSHGQTYSTAHELQNATFRLLLREHRDIDEDILKKLCHFLLSLYRTTTSGPKLSKNSFIPTSTANDMLKTRVVVLQYLPHFINLHLLSRCRESLHRHHFLDAFLLALYNVEATEQQALRIHLASVNTVPNNPLHRPLLVKVPTLSTSSSYHDNARLEGEDKLDQRPSGLTFQFENLSFIESLNASNRPQVLRVLLQTFNRHIVDISKSGLDQFVRATLKLLERGYNNQSGLQRICLDTPVQLELLYGAYVCMYNGFQVAANQIVDLIHERASLAGSPEVLLSSNSIKNLVLSSSPSQVSTSHVSTPVQIKNMITNASFRAKKLKDDIPKVQVDSIAEDDSAHSSGGGGSKSANLASMTSIVEIEENNKVENVEEKNSKSESSSTSKGFNRDKLKAKLQLRKSKPTSNDEPVAASSAAATSLALSVDHQPLLKSKLSFEKKEKKEVVSKVDKKKQKDHHRVGGDKMESEMIPLMPTQLSVSEVNGENSTASSSQPSEFDSVEKVEELIQKKLLPKNETITIHSPESGTTIF